MDLLESRQSDAISLKGHVSDESYSKLTSSIKSIELESDNLAVKLDNAKEKSERLSKSLEKAKLNPDNSKEVQELNSKISLTESKLQSSKNKANELKSSLSSRVKSNLGNELDKATSKIGSLGNKVKNVFTKNSGMNSFGKKLDDLTKKVSHFGKRISNLILSAFVFNVLSSGLSKLSQGLMSTLNSNNQFSSSLNQIKSNLLTAFAPIYNYVLPAINALMSALSSITGQIATFISGLFGQTASQAKQNAAALYGQAKAYDSVGKSAKEAEGNTASFDNLEVIGGNDNSGNSNSGASGGSDFSADVQQSGKLLDFLNQIKSLVSSGDFFGVGNLLASSVNDFLANIDVVSFTNKVHDILQGTVQVFNGFVTGLDWNLLGIKFSQLVVGLTGSLANAIESIDWTVLGKGISNFIAGIDLSQMVINFVSIFTNGLTGLTELIIAIDWSMVGQKLGNAIIDGLNTISSAISQIDWESVGESIKNFLCGIDWENILISIANVIISVGNAFWDTLSGMFGDDGANVIVMVIGAITGALAAYKLTSTAAAIANTLLGTSFELTLGPILLIGAAIGALIAIIVLCIKHWDDIKNAASQCWEWIKSVWSKAGEWFNNTIVQPIKNFFSGMWDGLKNGARNAWEGIKSIFSTVTTFFKDIFTKAWTAVKTVFSVGGKIFDGIKDGIVNAFKTIVNSIIKGINKVVSIPFNAINTALQKVKSIDILGAKPFNFIHTISVPQIPMLAKGAVIPPNAKFLAMLGDQTKGNNLEAPESLIRKIVREESGNNEVILNATFVVQCDDIEIGKASLKGLRLMEQKNGKKYLVN